MHGVGRAKLTDLTFFTTKNTHLQSNHTQLFNLVLYSHEITRSNCFFDLLLSTEQSLFIKNIL